MCDHKEINLEEGQYVCTSCGTILSAYIDETSEWTDEKIGYSTSELLPESSYGSVVAYRGIDNEFMKSVQRLSTWSSSSNNERSWIIIFDRIQSLCFRISLPKSIAMDACAMYKKMPDAQKVRGETRRALLGGSVFVACQEYGASRTQEEIANLFEVSIRSLSKAIEKYSFKHVSIMSSQIGFAERICSALSVSEDQRLIIISRINALNVDECKHTPKTMTVGIIAYVLNPKDMKYISEISGVSVLSIHKVLKNIKAGNMQLQK